MRNTLAKELLKELVNVFGDTLTGPSLFGFRWKIRLLVQDLQDFAKKMKNLKLNLWLSAGNAPADKIDDWQNCRLATKPCHYWLLV